MIAIALDAFQAAPGDPPDPSHELYQEERLSWALYSTLHNAYNAGATVNEFEVADFSGVSESLMTWVDSVDAWLVAAEASVYADEEVAAVPAIPDIISGLPAKLPSATAIVLSIVVRVAARVVGKWVERKLQPNNINEVAREISKIRQLLQGSGESPLSITRILELGLLDDVDNDSLLSTIKMAAHKGYHITFTKGDEISFIQEESLPDGL